MTRFDETVTMKGMDEVLAKFRKLEDSTKLQFALSAMKAGAKVTRAYAERYAPIGKIDTPGHEAGTLRLNIKVRSSRGRGKKGPWAAVRAGPPPGYHEPAYYASFVEFGHFQGKRADNAALGIEKGKRRTKAQKAAAKALDSKRRFVPAQPYMRPALDASFRQAVQASADDLRHNVERLVTSGRALLGPGAE